MDSKEYRFIKMFSDIRGMNASAHHNKPWDAIVIVRNWLMHVSGRKTIPSIRNIWIRYKKFNVSFLPMWCKDQDLERNELTFSEYSWAISEFLKGP